MRISEFGIRIFIALIAIIAAEPAHHAERGSETTEPGDRSAAVAAIEDRGGGYAFNARINSH